MLVQPASTNTSPIVGTASASTPSGLEQQAVRADIPPVFEAERDAETNNERYPGGSDDRGADGQPQAEGKDNQDSSPESQSSNAQSRNKEITGLSDEDKAIIEQLKVRDREVRIHEAAHAAVGGRYAGSPSFDYSRGPDGKNYATGGEVSISTSPIPGDPQATIEKARVVQAAALAPAQPSSQDRQVAAEAAQMELQAQSDLQAMKAEEAKEAEQKALNTDTEEDDEIQQSSEVSEEVAETESSADPVPVTVAQAPEVSDESSEESQSDRASQEEKPNARQELEKILLGSQNTLQQANQLGLVDPQNPYGKSGLLNIIA